MNGRWLNLGLLALALALPLLAAELLLRGLQLPRGSERVLLLAGSDLSSGPGGYRRYRPHRAIEHVALYGDQLAYRFRLRSNNLGLASHGDLAPGERIALAIAGDSFAEGQGGYSWIGELQQRWLEPAGLRSLNLAIAGSGFEDFAVAAAAAKRQHDARQLLILFIEHDAYRPYQRMGSNRHCSFYANGWLDAVLGPLACRLYGVVWHHVPAGLSDPELVRRSRRQQAQGLLPALAQAWSRLSPGQARPGPATTTTGLRFGAIPPAALAALARIRALYGREHVLLIQLPDQPHRGNRSAGAHSGAFASSLNRASGLEVVDLSGSCRLGPWDFHRLDNHPNSQGYRRLRNCLLSNPRLQSFLGLQPPQPFAFTPTD